MRIGKVGDTTYIEGMGSYILCPSDQYILEINENIQNFWFCGLHFECIDFKSWKAKLKTTIRVLKYIWLNKWYINYD